MRGLLLKMQRTHTEIWTWRRRSQLPGGVYLGLNEVRFFEILFAIRATPNYRIYPSQKGKVGIYRPPPSIYRLEPVLKTHYKLSQPAVSLFLAEDCPASTNSIGRGVWSSSGFDDEDAHPGGGHCSGTPSEEIMPFSLFFPPRAPKC